MTRFFGLRKAVCIGMFWGTVSLAPGLDGFCPPIGYALSLPARLTQGPRPFLTIAVSVLITAMAYAVSSFLGIGRRGKSERRGRRRLGAGSSNR